MSIGMLDEDVRRVVEPGTPPGRKRLEILGRFADAGIRTGVLVAPILPGLTDDDAHLEEVIAGLRRRRASQWATPIVLHVRPSIRAHFMPWVRAHVSVALPPLRASCTAAGVCAESLPAGALRALRPPAAQTWPGLDPSGPQRGRAGGDADRQLALAV